MKYLHHILGVPRHLLIPTPVCKEADNKALEEVLVITFYSMAGQTSAIKGDTNKHNYNLYENYSDSNREISLKCTMMPITRHFLVYFLVNIERELYIIIRVFSIFTL